jgi:hypothetical protein
VADDDYGFTPGMVFLGEKGSTALRFNPRCLEKIGRCPDAIHWLGVGCSIQVKPIALKGRDTFQGARVDGK